MHRSAFIERRATLLLGLILLLGVLTRVVLHTHAPVFTAFRDSADYFSAGFSLAEEGRLELPAKRQPVYAVVLGGLISLFRTNLEAIVLAQHLLGLGTVGLVYQLGAVTFGRPTGLVAALGAALSGSLLIVEHTLASEAVYVPLLVASLLLLFVAIRSGRRAAFLLAGLLLGLCALTRPTAPAILPLALGAVLFGPRPGQARLLGTGLLLLASLLPVGAWAVRNTVQHEVAAPSSGLGEALYMRVRNHDTGFDFRDLGELPSDPEQARIRRRVFLLAQDFSNASGIRNELEHEDGLNYRQIDAALLEASLQVIRQQPAYYLLSTAAMLGRLGMGVDQPVAELWESRISELNPRYWPSALHPVMEATDGKWPTRTQPTVALLLGLYQDHQAVWLFGPLFVAGTIRCLRSRQRWGWALALLPLLIFSQLLFYAALDGPLTRYRAPLQPAITLLTAAGLTWLAAGLRSAVARRAVRPPWPRPQAAGLAAVVRLLDRPSGRAEQTDR